MSESLSRLADLIRRESGVSLADAQLPSLRAAVLRAGGVAPEEFERRLGERRHERVLMTRLVDEVTVKETFLFRHPTDFASIDWHGMLERARAGGRHAVHVWCAACSTGEEAYTLAVLALEAFWPARAPVEVLATDIAASALASAAAGRYGVCSAAPSSS